MGGYCQEMERVCPDILVVVAAGRCIAEEETGREGFGKRKVEDYVLVPA